MQLEADTTWFVLRSCSQSHLKYPVCLVPLVWLPAPVARSNVLSFQIDSPASYIPSSQELTGLINLIIDLPEIAIRKSESIHSLKEQLIEEQKQDFKARLKSYRLEIRKEFQQLVGVEDSHDNRIRLFAYWFPDLFEDIQKIAFYISPFINIIY